MPSPLAQLCAYAPAAHLRMEGLCLMESNLTFRQRKERRERLAAWLGDRGVNAVAIDEDLAVLAKTEGPLVYSDMISVLTHLEMSPDEARREWGGIVKHQRTMSAQMASQIDIRVATLDYLLSVNRLIDKPKIVEIHVFDQVRESAITDGLTELYNYRYFQLSLNQEISRSRRFSKVFSVVLIDLDGFKSYNDTCGHPAGDDCLRRMARILMDNTRGLDLVARCGGDEFALLLPEVGHEGAEIVAGRLVERVKLADFPGQDRSPAGRITASIGIAAFPIHGRESLELLRAADQALYRVKSRGKAGYALAEPIVVDAPEGEIGVAEL